MQFAVFVIAAAQSQAFFVHLSRRSESIFNWTQMDVNCGKSRRVQIRKPLFLRSERPDT